jgi:hypothetical protein
MADTRVPRIQQLDAEQRWKAVKAHLLKGDQAKAKAEQHFITAGQHLAALKTQHDEAGGTWAAWEVLVKEKTGLGKSRASELMLIASGAKTVKQIRDADAEKHRKQRAISPGCPGENAGDPEASAAMMKAKFAALDDGQPASAAPSAEAPSECAEQVCAVVEDQQVPAEIVDIAARWQRDSRRRSDASSERYRAAKEKAEAQARELEADREAKIRTIVETIATLVVKHSSDAEVQSLVADLEAIGHASNLVCSIEVRLRELRPDLVGWDDDDEATA